MKRYGKEPLDATDRFWAKVDQSGGPSACQPWTAFRGRRGYGRFWDGTLNPNGRPHQVSTHRWIWERYIGPIPPGMFVCHHCDNPPCVNLDHLFLGTSSDNALDRENKGRGKNAGLPGEANKSAKLVAEQVYEIRRRADRRRETHAQIAVDYGVSASLVYQIQHRRVWKHLAEEAA